MSLFIDHLLNRMTLFISSLGVTALSIALTAAAHYWHASALQERAQRFRWDSNSNTMA